MWGNGNGKGWKDKIREGRDLEKGKRWRSWREGLVVISGRMVRGLVLWGRSGGVRRGQGSVKIC